MAERAEFTCARCHNRFNIRDRRYWKGNYICKKCFEEFRKKAAEERTEKIYGGKKKEAGEKAAEKAKGGWGRIKQKLVFEQPTKVSGRTFKIIAAIAITAIVLFANPMLPPLKDYLLELTAIFAPNVADIWETAVLLVSLLLITFVAFLVWYYNSSIPGIAVWGTILAITLIFPFVSQYLELGYASGPLSTLVCYKDYLLTGDAEAMAACQIESTGGFDDPDATKVGDYDVLSVSLSTEHTGNIITKTEVDGKLKLLLNIYFIELVVENPSDEITIKNFKIIDDNKEVLGNKDTALVRSGAVKSSEKIKLANLETLGRECMDEAAEGFEEYCDIEPGGILRLTLKAIPIECNDLEYKVDCELRDICKWVEDEDGDEKCASEDDRKTKEVEARVKFSYDYAGEGKFDFVVANSYETLWALISGRAPKTKSDGPVDIKVSFGPTAYLLREAIIEPEVILIIELSKEKVGEASIEEKIKITRLSDGVLSPPLSEGCVAPWGGIGLSSISDRTEELNLDGPKKLKRTHTYICTYTINKASVGDDGERIPFIVRANYSYAKTVTKRNILVKEEEYSRI